MNAYFGKTFLIIAMVATMQNSTNTQKSTNETPSDAGNYLIVHGSVESADKSIKGATVSLTENGQVVNSAVTNVEGIFKFKLNLNSEYNLEASADGFLSKNITFNTMVPKYEKGIWEVTFSVMLYKPCPQVDASILNKPRARIIFNDMRREFKSDKIYEDAMTNQVSKLEEDLLECQDRIYQEKVRKADNLLGDDKPEEAREVYVECLNERPDDEYVKDRLNEIDKILATSKNKDKLYDNYITQADKLYADKNYTMAREMYKRALIMKPNQDHPTKRIKELNDLLAQKLKADQAKQAIETKFQQLLTQGRDAYANKKFNNAVTAFKNALLVKPNDAMTSQLLADAQKMLDSQQKAAAASKDIQDKYYKTIAEADKLFNDKNLIGAKTLYEKAIAIIPDQDYPEQKVDEIEKLIKANAKAGDVAYTDAIDAADAAFKNKDYAKAKEQYLKALQLKTTDAYPKEQVTRIDKLVADQQQMAARQKSVQDQYNKTIAEADKLLAANDFNAAKTAYQKALTVIPEQEYPEQKIDEIDAKIKNAAKAGERAYTDAIDAADAAFKNKDYTKAKEQYLKATQLKATDTYPKEQVTRIDKLVADQQQMAARQKSVQDQYNKTIAEADKLLAANDLNAAKTAYQKALTVIPEQEYPEQKIDEIDAKIKNSAKAGEKAYDDAIDAADAAYKQKDYAKAKEQYQKALQLKAAETYPKDQIAAIDILVAEQQKQATKDKLIKESYNKTITEADNFLKLEDYAKAKIAYSKALVFMPDNEYPTQKIKDIENLLKNKDKESEAQFHTLINAADDDFDNRNFQKSKEIYQKALAIKTTDTYSQNRIAACDKLIAEQQKIEAQQKAIANNYSKAIAEADKLFAANDLIAARSLYQSAWQISPNEEYPEKKIKEVDQKIETQQAEKEKSYALKVQAADRAFVTKKYDEAKQNYQAALLAKPNETYPAKRIADIDKIIAEQDKLAADKKAIDENYKTVIAKADNLFTQKQFDQAQAAYQEASSIKPSEKYPYSKIDELNKLKQQIENERLYKQSITIADDFFKKKQFEQAKATYSKALSYITTDSYATKQIALAETEIANQLKLLADQKSRQAAFDKAIADGDRYLNVNDLDMAKASYQSAISIFVDKEYPKQKVIEIEKKLKDKKIDADYKAIINNANAMLAAKSYDQAIAKYKEALTIKPTEQFPNEKIKEIDKIIAQEETAKAQKQQNDDNYNAAIEKANSLFDAGQYDAAKTEYKKAQEIFPNEGYPKARIAKINELQALLAKNKVGTAKPSATKTTQIADLNFKNESEREAFLIDLLSKYPAGVTCEVYKEPRRTVTRYVIVRLNVASDFREVKWNWGGVDVLKNGKPITSQYYKDQIKIREGEYFSKTE